MLNFGSESRLIFIFVNRKKFDHRNLPWSYFHKNWINIFQTATQCLEIMRFADGDKFARKRTFLI